MSAKLCHKCKRYKRDCTSHSPKDTRKGRECKFEAGSNDPNDGE